MMQLKFSLHKSRVLPLLAKDGPHLLMVNERRTSTHHVLPD
jgi:hypothetical protein